MGPLPSTEAHLDSIDLLFAPPLHPPFFLKIEEIQELAQNSDITFVDAWKQFKAQAAAESPTKIRDRARFESTDTVVVEPSLSPELGKGHKAALLPSMDA